MFESANSLPRDWRSGPAMTCEVLAFAFGFLLRNPGAILRRVAFPALLGCVVLYFLVWGYCAELTDYLGFPSEGLASRVMGIAAASVLIMLLLHSIVVSRLAELLMGNRGGALGFLGIRPDAWRIYAANLRLLLGLGLYGLAMFGASSLMVRFGTTPGIAKVFDVAAWLLLCWLVARGWFFLVPISLQANEEGGLGMSWRCSEGSLPAIGGIMLVILTFTLVLLAAGEFLMRAAGVLSPVPASLTFVNAIGLYQRNLWPFVIMVSAVYLLSASLMTAARIRLYQKLAAAPPG